MSISGFPTSSDIYLEADGVRVAVVQSYTARTTKSSSAVEAFGETEPVATVPGQAAHVIELTRLYATDEAIRDGIDFYAMEDFSLVICKPDRKIVYSGCQWSAIQESADIGSMVLEKVTLVASKRLEMGA
ncbi:hypothetical protein D7V91_05205 [bacterium 1xD42-67]|nr:hypothetical protein D7V91_05205 [bacterium 1xD42-67]